MFVYIWYIWYICRRQSDAFCTFWMMHRISCVFGSTEVSCEVAARSKLLMVGFCWCTWGAGRGCISCERKCQQLISEQKREPSHVCMEIKNWKQWHVFGLIWRKGNSDWSAPLLVHAECFDQSVCYNYCWCPTSMWHMQSSLPQGFIYTVLWRHRVILLPSTLPSCFGTQIVRAYTCIVNHGLFTFPTLPHHTLTRAHHAPRFTCTLYIATPTITQEMGPPALVYLPSPFHSTSLSVIFILSQSLQHGIHIISTFYTSTLSYYVTLL